MGIKSSFAALVGAALAVSSCSPSETAALTEIMLVVDSDIAVPAKLDEIRMTITGPSGGPKVATAKLGSGAPGLPRSLALVRETGKLSPVEILVEGRLKGKTFLKREAKLAFLKGRTLVLPMNLLGACVDLDTDCKTGETCTENGCKSSRVDPGSLADWSGTKPEIDGGGNQNDGAMSGVDASMNGDAGSQRDGGSRDAGSQRDGGSRDSGIKPMDSGTPDAGIMCTLRPEMCNGSDDNCNEQIDEGFDFANDPDHCGSCPNVCKMSTRLCCAGVCKTRC